MVRITDFKEIYFMDIQDRRGLKHLAAEKLNGIPNARRIVLIWAGASALVSLLVSFISFLLDGQIEGTGGLSGIGLRSILTTAQTLFSLANVVLMPFWSLGYTACVLRFSRDADCQPQNLFEGFRRIGPAFRMMLLRALLYMGVILLAGNLASILFSMSPSSLAMYELMELHEEAFLAGTVSDAVAMELLIAMKPMLIGGGLLCAAVLIPVLYRLRLAEFRLMDEPRCRARVSLLESNRLMRRNGWALFRLDLSFWWYFLAELLAASLCYGDILLTAFGIPLPMGSDLAFFLFYVLGLGAQVALLYYKGNFVQTTYALFYRALSAPKEKPQSL